MIMSIMTSEFEKFFHQADTDEDGFLSMQELTSCLRAHGYKGTDDDIYKYFKLADMSGDNKISMAEYMVSMQEADIVLHSTAAMRRIFNMFDQDGNGSIDKGEMKSILEEMGKVFSDEEVDKMIALADTDQSGTLEYEEFILAMFSQPRP